MASTTTSSGAALTVSQDPSIVTVIERFGVPADRKDEAVEAARGHIARSWKNDPLFVGAALFRGRDHDRVSCYAQWKRADLSMTPDAPPASQTLAPALPAFETLESRTFSMDFVENAQADAAPTEISTQGTPLAHYGLFSVGPGNQNRVVDLGRSNSPQSLGTPGLLSINWHRSLDGERVINLGMWTHFDGMAQLGQQEGFNLETGEVYWKGYADWKGEEFDVVAVETRR